MQLGYYRRAHCTQHVGAYSQKEKDLTCMYEEGTGEDVAPESLGRSKPPRSDPCQRPRKIHPRRATSVPM
jgi:hypothetical protein